MGAAALQEPAAVSSSYVEAVGNAFVLQYYHVLHQSPEIVHRFYQEDSKMGRPVQDGAMGMTTTIEAIKEKIQSLDYGDFRAEIKTVDAQESFSGGVLVLVTGYLTGKDEVTRKFTQAFFLAPQVKGYFVLNDAFRYVEDVRSQEEVHVPENEIENPVTQDQGISSQETPVLVKHTAVEEETVEESGEAAVSSKALDVTSAEPVAEVVNETSEITPSSPDSISTTKEVQKKSYASIVKVPVALPNSAPATAKDATKTVVKQIKVVAAPVGTTDKQTLSKDGIENGNQQHEEGYSIYIKALPMNATPAQVEAEFKQFGPIKRGGVQVRSSKGFYFGFVEFEEASAVPKAIQASPIIMGGHEVFVQEKKSTNSRVNNQQRFPVGRGNGFKYEDDQGRGSNGGGRGYGRSPFNNYSANNVKGGDRGFYNRGGRNGYQKSDNGNERNPSGMLINKPTVPRISAIA
uniref:Uncharacterized protein n=1 Tax=Kalanchoe fedtschenkoi TaxID=63787 RepID=A0A7N0TP72_KALFE